ncbi:hypothetical protein PAJL_82 [Cutibacterium acnes HL042PA3]|nr:hypothetical protein HMPREF9206_1630 [Cutibacterium acnes J139]EFT27268.1 hypothetical protein HMPREF9577_00045 [Cutibacterium acnes HL110PA3]EFT64374.1 hypothetical protein HMPREF9578_01638 [Cutibacterium acnes HL110PA4]ESK59511.1 hypothetical protein PAJL_82 [Cutibacterium acnes HL042PA3]MCW5113404.1 hypothetical protein [Cutibacterium acnes P05]
MSPTGGESGHDRQRTLKMITGQPRFHFDATCQAVDGLLPRPARV